MDAAESSDKKVGGWNRHCRPQLPASSMPLSKPPDDAASSEPAAPQLTHWSRWTGAGASNADPTIADVTAVATLQGVGVGRVCKYARLNAGPHARVA